MKNQQGKIISQVPDIERGRITEDQWTQNFEVGDKAQYNKRFNPGEVVTIEKVERNYCVIVFPSGCRITTRVSGLWPLQEYQLRIF